MGCSADFVSLESRLAAMGVTYDQYLRSDHWRDVRRRYGEQRRYPKECLGCGSPGYQLHHRSYRRIGREELSDLLPLCGRCHSRVHEYSRLFRIPVSHTHAILRRLFKWTKSETKRKFAPWRLKGRPNGFALTPRKASS